ncbi:MAG: nickel pincer cofactor biosynthesis protein LarB [Chthoniobacterales bacterium]
MSDKFADLGYARVDLERRERCGHPEVIFCAGKLPEEVVGIAREILAKDSYLLATRATQAHYDAVVKEWPQAQFSSRARCIAIGSAVEKGGLPVAVLCAGTSDLPVAEEAVVTLKTFGRKAETFYDVGVAGLHRLTASLDQIRRCAVVIVVAGMEGALPSVVAGLVDRPILAVPTSIGYGTSFEGLAALLGMLNSCGNGVMVVNIDNGFGAACAADAILRIPHE